MPKHIRKLRRVRRFRRAYQSLLLPDDWRLAAGTWATRSVALAAKVSIAAAASVAVFSFLVAFFMWRLDNALAGAAYSPLRTGPLALNAPPAPAADPSSPVASAALGRAVGAGVPAPAPAAARHLAAQRPSHPVLT